MRFPYTRQTKFVRHICWCWFSPTYTLIYIAERVAVCPVPPSVYTLAYVSPFARITIIEIYTYIWHAITISWDSCKVLLHLSLSLFHGLSNTYEFSPCILSPIFLFLSLTLFLLSLSFSPSGALRELLSNNGSIPHTPVYQVCQQRIRGITASALTVTVANFIFPLWGNV